MLEFQGKSPVYSRHKALLIQMIIPLKKGKYRIGWPQKRKRTKIKRFSRLTRFTLSIIIVPANKNDCILFKIHEYNPT